jgi:Asp/Glu/hydantoin racemase
MSSLTRLLTAAVVACFSGPALARISPALPEPDILSLLGVGAVAGIIAWRIRRRK